MASNHPNWEIHKPTPAGTALSTVWWMDFGGWRQSSCTRATIWAYWPLIIQIERYTSQHRLVQHYLRSSRPNNATSRWIIAEFATIKSFPTDCLCVCVRWCRSQIVCRSKHIPMRHILNIKYFETRSPVVCFNDGSC
jgi:hypothetical protein